MRIATLVLLSLAFSVVALAAAPEASARCEDNPLEPGIYCEGYVSNLWGRVTCTDPKCR